jgi:hypothetical protein
MPTRDLRPGHPEQWSQRNQTLRHGGEKRARDDESMLHDPTDYSAIGGPDDQRVYGYVRGDSGHYPWNQYGQLQGRDAAANPHERGGYLKSIADWHPQRHEK